jgi:GNAT superfamily N-acetyltransferase
MNNWKMNEQLTAILEFFERDTIANFEILYHLQSGQEARIMFRDPSYLIELPSARKVFLGGEPESAMPFLRSLSLPSYLIHTEYNFLQPLKISFIVREVEMYLVYVLKEENFVPVRDARVRPLIPRGSPISYQVGQEKISLETFYGLFLGDKLVSYGGTQFETEKWAEIAWLKTEEEHRGKGYGLKVVSAIVEDLLREGKVPIYRVSAENIASRRLAEKLGFQLHSRFFYVSVKLKG